MSLETPESIRRLQRKLYIKAKQEPQFRFYLLYDKVYRPDILHHAYRLCRKNKGKPGVDGVTFEQIEQSGLEQWLSELGKELREQTYRAQAVRRVMIPKNGGGQRPLGIPTIRDRVAQTAAKLVLEPIFEAEFVDEAHGYRPQRSGVDAVKQVHQALREGYTQVVDADLSKYFDTIPHPQLMRCIARRVMDGKMLRLVRMWLKVPVQERDPDGTRRYTGGRNSSKGTPQGGVISPLLANVYMHRYLKFWHQSGQGRQLRARLVNYADDFVILSRGKAKAREAMEWTQQVMDALGLTLNMTKTCIRDACRETFDFLGYSFGPEINRRTQERYLGARPSAKSVRQIKQKLHDWLSPGNVRPWDQVAAGLNRMVHGWANYFSYCAVGAAYRSVDSYVYHRVRQFLRRRKVKRLPPTGRSLLEWDVVRLESVHGARLANALT